MKKIISLCILIFSMFFVTGCSIKTPVQDSFVEAKVMKDLKKVSTEEVHFAFNKSNVVAQRPSGIVGFALTYEIDTGELNNIVLNNYLKQYFSNVSSSNKIENKGLYIESKVNDFDFVFGPYGLYVNVKTNVSIKGYYNGKLLVDKKYKGEKNTTGISVTKLTPADLYSETFHEAVLNIYRNEFQNDLLNALKKEGL